MALCANLDSVTDGFALVLDVAKPPSRKGFLIFMSTLQAFITTPRTGVLFPLLDWAIGNLTCEQAQLKDYASTTTTPYACQANSVCIDSDNGPGYRYNCSVCYQGNPYLPNGNGCKDIDECKNPSLHECTDICVNTVGSYTCSCPKGYNGDGRKNGGGCRDIDECANPSLNNCTKICINTIGGYKCSCPSGYRGDGFKGGKGCTWDQLLAIKVSVGIGIALVVLLMGCSWLYWGYKKRKLMRLKEKFFQQNGGMLLQQQLSEREISNKTTKIFTSEELEKATNNYDEKRIIGQGGYGIVYKGILPDDRTVAIKKSKVVDKNQIEQFINEVVILSQINHRNVVKLLGCCFETEVPLLVYEFITNGTLFDHIHNEGKASCLSWEIRLRIATETAGVLSYLHAATSTPIIHRDVKSTNILLDDNYTAKVSDFGASRLVPLDETQISTMVQGTLGYLDPEYLLTSQLTEKSDVYSFGVVLVELLTGKKPHCFKGPEEERCLAMYFLSSLKDDRLFHVLEDHIVQEGNTEQLKEIANLAKRCLRVKGEERPTMKEVAMELEGLRMMEKHPWVNDGLNSEETECLIGEQPDTYRYGGNVNMTAGYDSIRGEVSISVGDGR